MSELKPCPLCECKADYFYSDGVDISFVDPVKTQNSKYATIRCRSCFCGIGLYADEQRAAEAWNRRAQPASDGEYQGRFDAICQHYGIGQSDRYFLQQAIDALEEQDAQPANEPLTLEELRGMHGEPVYIVQWPDWGHWELSTDAEGYLEDRDPDFYGMTMPPAIPDPMGRYGLHMLGWLAYRRKPEGGEVG